MSRQAIFADGRENLPCHEALMSLWYAGVFLGPSSVEVQWLLRFVLFYCFSAVF